MMTATARREVSRHRRSFTNLGSRGMLRSQPGLAEALRDHITETPSRLG